jgi:hypothetical protein
LLKVKALKALFNVVILFTQKFINKKEEIPIISQPKINVIQLPAHKRVTIDKTNNFNKNIKYIIFTSYLMYTILYAYAATLIAMVNILKL